MRKSLTRFCAAILVALGAVPAVAGETSVANDRNIALAQEIFGQLIEIDTSHSSGSVKQLRRQCANGLLGAGFVEKRSIVDGSGERKKNLVVRFRGAGKAAPILIFAHLDVVEAKRSDWTPKPQNPIN